MARMDNNSDKDNNNKIETKINYVVPYEKDLAISLEEALVLVD